MASDTLLPSDHPLVLELASLREAVAHFQGEAYRATVQLRHRSLEDSTLLQHAHALENENSYLRTELQVHRAAGSVPEHRDALQVQELTLALRRLSDKLDLTEKVLLERCNELASARNERDAARKVEAIAMENVRRLRSEVAAGDARERDLASRVKASEEQRRMTDLVVEEYASLVRFLEGRSSSSSRKNGESARSSLDGLMHARQGLQKLLQDSNHDSGQLHAEIDRLHDLLESNRIELEAERAAALEHKQALASLQLELHQLKCDDNSAAKMVSRYMKFSQSSTDLLHGTIEKLKARQEAIVASYEARLQQFDDKLASERRQSDMLRRALDELTEDISREAYGRRREIALRLALLGREEMLAERLRRWFLKTQEILLRVRSSENEDESQAALERIFEDAQSILVVIDGTNTHEENPASSAARIFAAYATVKALQGDLQRETDKRLYFEYQLANSFSEHIRPKPLVGKAPGTMASDPATSIQPELSVAPAYSTSPVASPSDAHSNGRTNIRIGDEVQPASEVLVPKSGSPDQTEDDSPLDLPHPAFPTHGPKSSTIDVQAIPQVESNGACNATPSESSDDAIYSGFPAEISEKGAAVDRSQATKLDEIYFVAEDEKPVPTIQPLDVEKKDETDTRAGPTDESSPIQAAESRGSSDGEAAPISLEVPVQERAESSLVPSFPQIPMPQDERYRDPSAVQLETSISGASLEADNSKANLLSRLADVDERYSDMQRSFRDCHLALQDLKQSSTGAPNSSILNVAIERLSDYCEDARVELEIRISDEERIAKGFQTLLSIPGALSNEVNEQEVTRQIEAFLDGTDATVQRSQDILKRKLDDLEHDIASIKYAMHTPTSPALAPQDLKEQGNSQSSTSWTTWTGSILGSSRAPSPAPSFGTIMTSPRLRHSSSTRSLRGESDSVQNPLANLHLRIPMPSNFRQQVDRPVSPTKQRSRPQITPNILGLGLRGGFRQGMSRPSLSMTSNRNFSPMSPTHTEDVNDLDSDIE